MMVDFLFVCFSVSVVIDVTGQRKLKGKSDEDILTITIVPR